MILGTFFYILVPLYKENVDTMQAVDRVATALKVQESLNPNI
jgi:tRNA(Glu) U13 pseudouridine synthase TruD